MMILYLREKKRKEILSNIVEPLSVQLNLSNINTRGYIYIGREKLDETRLVSLRVDFH